MKTTVRFAVVALLFLTTCMIGAERAEAIILEFQVGGHPDRFDSGFGVTKDFWLFPPGFSTQHFHFVDVKLTVDTSTGNATLNGDMTHLLSGEPWEIDANITGIGTKGSWFGSNVVPYDTMFDDLEATVPIDPDNRITYTDAAYTLTPLVSNPTYNGPTDFLGMVNGSGTAHIIRYRHDLPLSSFPTSQYDLFVSSGWLGTPQGDHAGDFKWTFSQLGPPSSPPPTTVIPEPASMTMVGLGIALGIYARRRRGTS